MESISTWTSVPFTLCGSWHVAENDKKSTPCSLKNITFNALWKSDKRRVWLLHATISLLQCSHMKTRLWKWHPSYSNNHITLQTNPRRPHWMLPKTQPNESSFEIKPKLLPKQTQPFLWQRRRIVGSSKVLHCIKVIFADLKYHRFGSFSFAGRIRISTNKMLLDTRTIQAAKSDAKSGNDTHPQPKVFAN